MNVKNTFCSNSILYIIRNYTSKVKPKIDINSDVYNNVEAGAFKPRKHPGVFKPKTIVLPDSIIESITKAMNDFPVKQILNDSKSLVNYLNARRPPIEKNDFINKRLEAEQSVLPNQPNLDELNEEDKSKIENKIELKITKVLKTKIYAWKPIDYTIHKTLQYLLGRSAAEYAALYRIFQEIQARDLEFKPRSFFDFGSGVGTGSWAVRQFWQNTLFEYFNVDTCAHMNDLAMILLKGGTGMNEHHLKGVFYRQFLPALNTTYDIVLSAYSLLELPSAQSRLETVVKLWNKTQQYLILVEQGTNVGFQVINEARDFILNIKNESNRGHVFSPCPHDQICPRFLLDKTPCNFDIFYKTIPVGQNSELKTERFSYVVLRKDSRKTEMDFWPRIVRPTLVRSKHAVCRMCTAEGKLDEVIFTASKHGKIMYRCAKATNLGDLLPMTIKTIDNDENNNNYRTE